MRWVWSCGIFLSAVLVSVAYADTVYLKDGQVIWGTESFEEGSEVVLIRPSGPIRFPKGQVDRVEPAKVSLPPYYSPPGEPLAAPARGGPGAADAPGAPPPPPGGAAPAPSSAPTELPPAPPPPPPR